MRRVHVPLDDLEATSPPATRLTRRDVLALSSVAAVGTLVPWSLHAAKPAGLVEPLSVGYIAGSDRFASYAHLSWRDAGRASDGQLEVLPAGKIEAESRTYAEARVRVTGIYPNSAAPGPLGMALTVLMPGALAGTTHPFYPWTARGGTRREVAPPITFKVPLSAGGGLELLLEISDPDAKPAAVTGKPKVGGTRPPATGGVVRTYGTRFTSTGEGSVPRLRRGLYLLGAEWGMWETPQLLPPADKPPRYDRLSLVLAVEPILDPLDP